MILHIDTSVQLRASNRFTGIGVCTPSKDFNKGACLSPTLKKAIKKHPKVTENYAHLYAACIWRIIEENVDDIDLLIICNDENFSIVKESLLTLSGGTLSEEQITSISDYRSIMNKNVKSAAHSYSRKYKRYGKSESRANKYGLNVISLSIPSLRELLERL